MARVRCAGRVRAGRALRSGGSRSGGLLRCAAGGVRGRKHHAGVLKMLFEQLLKRMHRIRGVAGDAAGFGWIGAEFEQGKAVGAVGWATQDLTRKYRKKRDGLFLRPAYRVCHRVTIGGRKV